VQNDVDDRLPMTPEDVLDEGSSRLAELRVVRAGVRPPRRSRRRLALGESDQQGDIGEDGRRRRAPGVSAAMPHRSPQVVGHDAAVVDGRTERCQVTRCRLGDR